MSCICPSSCFCAIRGPYYVWLLRKAKIGAIVAKSQLNGTRLHVVLPAKVERMASPLLYDVPSNPGKGFFIQAISLFQIDIVYMAAVNGIYAIFCRWI